MTKENMLGTRPIPRLLLQFGLPSVISMLVNSIYNLVDQIFIGQRVGYLGNAATNVTFPFVTTCLAISLMISVGTAANVGLNLGRKDQERADRTLGNGFCLAIIAGIVLLIIGQIFLVPLLKIFGATELVLPYAIDYARIYIIGIPFVSIGIMLNDEIRADGSPSYTMRSMLIGAVINIVFDYIFVFPLNMGVQGAAIATIMGQFVTMILGFVYLPRMKTLHFEKKNVKLEPVIVKDILLLGLSSFITQIAMLFMQIVLNRQAVKYGALSKYGAEIPLTVFGIVMKVNQIMTSIILGITTGSQPVFSYNYGARKYTRVRDLVKALILTTSVIGAIGTVCLQLFPQQIISIFGQENELYNEFAVMAIRNMTFLIFILGVQMTASVYFQAVGKPRGSVLISLSRQILFMIPLLFILPLFLGVKGVMFSFPGADIASVILCSILLFRELKDLNQKIASGEGA
ncbi:MAG: MATE family efflux transporter [Blautia sp.]|nr:MATE family efflux transporter [Blautia sp.]